jgi:hypothetical protein
VRPHIPYLKWNTHIHGDKTENIRQLAYRAGRYNARVQADNALVRKLLDRYKKE